MIRDVAPRVMRWVLKDRGECSRQHFRPTRPAVQWRDARRPPPAPYLGSRERSDVGLYDPEGHAAHREQWISLMWPVGPPKPWCIEHEVEVPEFWQRPELVEAEEEEEFGAQTPWRPRKTPATPSEEVK